jgi:acyl CoA:acetate/3-ketoacid CoA transferase beta subunit
MRPYLPKVVITVPRHSRRALPETVDFATTVAASRNRDTTVITDLALLRLDAGRLGLVSRRAGVRAEDVRAQTGFEVDGDGDVAPGPTEDERKALERLDPGGIRHGMI